MGGGGERRELNFTLHLMPLFLPNSFVKGRARPHVQTAPDVCNVNSAIGRHGAKSTGEKQLFARVQGRAVN